MVPPLGCIYSLPQAFPSLIVTGDRLMYLAGLGGADDLEGMRTHCEQKLLSLL